MTDNMQEHPVGFLKVPSNIEQRPQLLLGGRKFMAPRHVDLRDYCTPTKDQKTFPACAAFSASSLVENILWRRDDYPTTFDPMEVYRYAKKHDGDPNGDGTTLNAALEYFLDKGLFSKDAGIQFIYGGDIRAKTRYCIHKFGVMHCGLNVTDEWYLCNKNKTSIVGGRQYRSVGGHAVLATSYDDDVGGVYVLNSWSESFGAFGFALITWEEFEREFLYGCIISHCLDGFKLNT